MKYISMEEIKNANGVITGYQISKDYLVYLENIKNNGCMLYNEDLVELLQFTMETKDSDILFKFMIKVYNFTNGKEVSLFTKEETNDSRFLNKLLIDVFKKIQRDYIKYFNKINNINKNRAKTEQERKSNINKANEIFNFIKEKNYKGLNILMPDDIRIITDKLKLGEIEALKAVLHLVNIEINKNDENTLENINTETLINMIEDKYKQYTKVAEINLEYTK